MKLLGETRSRGASWDRAFGWLVTALGLSPLFCLFASLWIADHFGRTAARAFVVLAILALSGAIARHRVRTERSGRDPRPLAPFILWAVAVGGIFLLIAGEWRMVPLGGLLVFASFARPWGRRSSRPMSISCPHCGYDRSGIGARGKCPECGRGMWL